MIIVKLYPLGWLRFVLGVAEYLPADEEQPAEKKKGMEVMSTLLKRFLSLMLALVMVISMMPANTVFATGTDETETTPTESVPVEEPVVASVEDQSLAAQNNTAVPEGLQYEVSTYQVYVTITGYVGDATTLEIPSVIEGLPVTTIEEAAFAGCSSLMDITIPSSVTLIGHSAFSGCTGLTQITIPNGVENIGQKVFADCTGLTQITIPNSVETIGSEVFSNCTGLTQIVIPNSVESVGEKLFQGCRNLQSITLPVMGDIVLPRFFGSEYYEGSVCIYSGGSISRACYVPAGLRSVTVTGGEIPYGAFDGCYMLTSIVLSSNVTSIHSSAFADCTGLTSIELPAGVTSMGHSVFSGCTGLTAMVIPEGVATIGSSTFRNCSNLRQVSFGKKVTAIAGSAFEGCSSLTDVYYGGSPSKWEDIAISDGNEILTSAAVTIHFAEEDSADVPQGMTFEIINNETVTITGYTGTEVNIVIPETIDGLPVTKIGNSAFAGKNDWTPGILQSIVIPDSVEEIGEKAFQYCQKLNTITIGSGIKTIGHAAFERCAIATVNITDLGAWCSITYPEGAYGCYPLMNMARLYLNGNLLTNAEIPEGVTSIAPYAFFGCRSLTSVNFPSTLRSIGRCAFGETGITSISIPQGVAMGDCVFSGCQNLESVTLPSGLTQLPGGIFENTRSLKQITLPSGLESIGMRVFAYSGLESIVIPDSVTYLGESSFGSCPNLVSITIPAGVTSNLNLVFADEEAESVLNHVLFTGNAAEWEEITAPAESDMYAPESNTLKHATVHIGADGDEVTATGRVNAHGNPVYYCEICNADIYIESAGKYFGYEIKDNAARILYFSAWDMTEAVIPAKIKGVPVTEIMDYAFAHSNITSVTIPATVKNIRSSAFEMCQALTDVYYEGIQEQWNYVQIDAGNESFLNAQLHFGEYTVPVPAGLQYTETDSTVTITGYEGTATELEIPLQINGKLVTAIGEGAFQNNSTITAVTIPITITTIGASAFERCTALAAVTVPESVTTLGKNAFAYCGNLAAVTLSDSLATIDDYTFAGCTALSQLTIPGALEAIGAGAFQKCISLTELAFLGDAPTFGEKCFENTYLTIYYHAGDADWDAVVEESYGGGITWVKNEGTMEGLRYEVRDGMLTITGYTGTETEVIIPARIGSQPVDMINGSGFSNSNVTHITIPGTIESYWFRDCSKLVSVTIGEGATCIPSGAFAGCSGLTELHLPASLKEISGYAFNGSQNIQTVYYAGTREQWDKVVLGADNGFFYRVNLYCGDKPVTADGFQYQETDSEVTILGYQGSEKFVEIPAAINGKPVAAIGDGAFENTKITNIVIPASVRNIGSAVFKNCNKLSEITFLGTAPVFADDSFTGASPSVWYPAEDATWNSVIGNTYGGTITWVMSDAIPEGMEYTISGKTASITAYTGNAAQLVLPSRIDGRLVTKIAENVFKNNVTLTAVTLPKYVTLIDDYAFYGCTGLTKIVFPESLASLGWAVFANCTGLDQITFTGSAPSSHGNEFRGVTATCYYPADKPSGYYSFGGNLTLVPVASEEEYFVFDHFKYTIISGENGSEVKIVDYTGSKVRLEISATIDNMPVTMIGDKAFASSSFFNVTIPESVRSIGENAFSGCVFLEEIAIPASVVEIGDSAFSGCGSLKSISLVEGLKTIGDSAFSGCSSLEKLVIPNTVESIGKYACNTGALKSITIPFVGGSREENTFFGYIMEGANAHGALSSVEEVIIAGENTAIPAEAFKTQRNIKNVIMTNGVTSIGYHAFYYCTGLTSITIPGSVRNVGYEAFFGCSELETVILEEGVTSVAASAFSYCQNIKQIKFPSTINTVGDFAFENFSALKDIYFNGTATEWNALSIAPSNTNLLSENNKIVVDNAREEMGDPDAEIYIRLEYGGHSMDSAGKVEWLEVDVTPTLIPSDNTPSEYAVTIHTFAEEVTFRIPVPNNSVKKVAVYHGDEFMGYYEIYGNGNGRYIEVSSATFSEFTWKSIGEGDLAAAIGDTGYATLAEAVAAALDGDTITLLANGQSAEVGKNVTIVKNGYTAEITALTNFTATETDTDYVVQSVHVAKIGDVGYTTISEALAVAREGDTIRMLKDIQESFVLLQNGATLDLNGHTLTCDNFITLFGTQVMNTKIDGILKVPHTGVSLQATNIQIPVWNGVDGYYLVDIGYGTKLIKNADGSIKYSFMARPRNGENGIYTTNTNVIALLQNGAADNQIDITVHLNWEDEAGTMYQRFVYNENQISTVYTTNSTAQYSGWMFNITVTNYENYDNVTLQAVVESDMKMQDAAVLKYIPEDADEIDA